MNKIQEVMKKGVEEFKEKYTEPDDNGGWREKKIITPSMVISHIKSHQKAILEAMLEEVSIFELDTSHLPKEKMSIDESIEFSLITGRNQALQDIETIINKAIGV